MNISAGHGRRPYLVSGVGAPIRYSSYDVLIIGGGIAGLTAAIGAANRWNVGLITKGTLVETTTFLAQGGIAAAMGEYDSPELHMADTLEAGAGLCDAQAVRILVEEGPERVRELQRLGAKFDQRDGKLILGSEGAHSVARVVHAGGDATGSVVASTLAETMAKGRRVELHEDEFAIDLLTHNGRCVGAVSVDEEGELTVSLARAVVLACGGAGQLFTHTTNPVVATGDGHAMAFRAGAIMRDMEFVQFHPTALYAEENPTLLLTEALRGEGAYLLDDTGVRFMVGAHPRAELAPRDVVVRNMKRVMDRDGVDHVWLDARHLEADFLCNRFPTVFTGLAERGFDLSSQLTPIVPVAHYYMGGILTDEWGRTSVQGLYACGETASTGVHGANRLASNSLLEGLVFGERAVRDINRYLELSDPIVCKIRLGLNEERHTGNDLDEVATLRRHLMQMMTEGCGIVRNRQTLEQIRVALREIRASLRPPGLVVAEMELINLLTVAEHMVESALLREESRGSHLRSDFSERDDAHWRRHILLHSSSDNDEPVVSLSELRG